MQQGEGRDSTRRDAIARGLCARICDERHGIETLQALDAVLTRFENDSTMPCDVVDLLRNDRYAIDGCDIERRKGWNAGIEHAIAMLRADRGLAELREAQAIDLRLRRELVEFDVGGES